MNKLKISFIFLLSSFLFLPLRAFAFCPACLVAIGTATGVFRWLGVDDSIIGLWIGGFIFSLSIFLSNLLIRKVGKIKFQSFLIAPVFYLLAILILWRLNALVLYNTIWGINKIIFGMIIGGLLLLITPYFDRFLRKLNQGKIFISHQKMLLAVGSLLIASLILHLIIK